MVRGPLHLSFIGWDMSFLRKCQSSSQYPRRAAWKNVQTTGQLYLSPMLVRLCSKSSKLGFSIMWTKKFQMFKLGLKKGRGTRDQIANICWIIEKAREFRKNIYLCFIDYAKAFNCVDHNKLWKALKEMGIQDYLTCLLINLYEGQEPTVRNPVWSNRAVCCHQVYLPYTLSTSWEMPGWVCYKLDQDRWEKYQQFQICGWYYPNSRKWRRTKEVLDEGEEGEWKSWVKTI